MAIQHKALKHINPHRFFCLNKQDTPSGFYNDLFTLHFVSQVMVDIKWYNNHIQDVIKSMGSPKGPLEFSIMGDHNRFFYIRRDNVNRFFLVGQDYDLKDVVWRLGSKSELFTKEILESVLETFEIDPVEFKQVAYNFLFSRNLQISAEELKRPSWWKRINRKKEQLELVGAECGGAHSVWFTQEHFLFKPSITEVEVTRLYPLESARTDYKGNGRRVTSRRFIGDVDPVEVIKWITETQLSFMIDWDVFSIFYSMFQDAGVFNGDLSDWNLSGVTQIGKLFDVDRVVPKRDEVSV